ncbi:PKD domain-containing protein [Hydrogenophaga sp. MI9]|uniref:PKD domain-containing protein n=1 Tax=Hydrogenophaga sp. MI9 TaxID=3453719 RepID=UPI003EEA1BEC
MSPARLWRLLLVSMLAVLVVACKPYASFTVTPEPVVAGQVATFDASGTLVDPLVRKNTVTAYTWDFGDSTTGTGKIATHTYAAAGTYTVKLTVKDKAGQVGSTTEALVVQTAATPTAMALKVSILGADGVLLPNAQVSLGTLTATSNAEGVASLDQVPFGVDQVLHVTKAGFVAQTVRVSLEAGKAPPEVAVRLIPVKETLTLIQAEAAQMVLAKSVGSSVLLPANALVDAQGQVATGAITMQLTPWDVKGSDLLAMPGQGHAGNNLSLVATGLMTVHFLDAAGNTLQLGAGKTADIQMDLPFGSINGQTLAEGSTLPLWHFDEHQGLWVVEGQGTVVTSTGSPSGLAIKSTVSHFSTWSWGLPNWATGSAQVSCVNTSGTLIPCILTGTALFSDSWGYSNTIFLAPAVTTTTGLPTNGQIIWTAVTTGGLRGQTTAAAHGSNVVITLGLPATDQYVSCKRQDGSDAACWITISGTYPSGTTGSEGRFIPAGGARVQTTFDLGLPLNWSAGANRVDTGGNTYNSTGTSTTTTNTDVVIALGAETVIAGKSVRVQCDPVLKYNEATVSTCSLGFYLYDGNGELMKSTETPTMPAGTPVTITVPAQGAMTASAWTGTPPSAFGGWTAGSITLDYNTLSENALVVIQMIRFYIQPT